MNTPIDKAIKALFVMLSMQAIQAHAQDSQPQTSTPTASTPDQEKAKETGKSAVAADASLQKVEVSGFAASVGFSQTRANVTVTKEDIDKYPPGVSGDKILEHVSGIQQGSSNALGGSTFDSTINMRGFEKDSIGFSVDGIPNGRTTLGGGAVPSRFFDSSNLASVQVSQSAGQIGAPTNQALAGQINYITADPTEKFGAAAELGVGSANTQRAYALINSGEFGGGFKGYLSISDSESQVSYVSHPSGENTLGHLDFKLVKDFDNGVQVKLKYSYNDITETSAANVVTLQQFKSNSGSDGFTDSWTGKPQTDVNYRGFYGNPRKDQMTYLSTSIPVFESGLLDVKVYNANQAGVGKYADLGSTYSALNGSQNSIYYRANFYDINRNGALAELSGGRSQYLNWRVGAWVEEYTSGQNREFYPLTDPTVNDAYSSAASLTSSRLSWHDNTELLYAANTSRSDGGDFRVDYGVTYLRSNVNFTAPIYSDTSSNLASDKFNYQGEARANSGILPKVGLLYKLSPSLQVFAGYAKNAASISDPTVQANATPASAPLNPATKMDTANAFDIGVRKVTDSYSIGLQGFVIRAKQTFASDIATNLTVQNVPEGRNVQGIELNYKQSLGRWTFYTAATVQQCKYSLTDVDDNGYPAAGFIKNGADCLAIAKENLFSEASYQVNSRIDVSANLRLKSGWAGYYANPRIANSGVNDWIPSSTLVGLNIAYKGETQQFGLNVENLTNRHYISGLAPELEASSSASGRYFIGAPLSLFLWYRVKI